MQLILTLSTPKELDLYYIGLGKLFFCNKIDLKNLQYNIYYMSG